MLSDFSSLYQEVAGKYVFSKNTGVEDRLKRIAPLIFEDDIVYMIGIDKDPKNTQKGLSIKLAENLIWYFETETHNGRPRYDSALQGPGFQ